MLLLAGREDHTVDPGNTLQLAARLRAAGVSVSDELYPDVGHLTVLEAFGWPLVFLAPAREATLQFVAAHNACRGSVPWPK